MSGACYECRQRAWLLDRVGVTLDFKARDLPRFWRLLELPDRELIDAIGGRRRGELADAYSRWQPMSADMNVEEDISTTCRHRMSYPTRLRERTLAPHALSVRGGIKRFGEILDRQVVAIVGTRRATDYGMETARELARGLTACGVTIAGALDEGIAAAVHSGALEGDGQMLTVMAGGLEQCSPAWCEGLYRRTLHRGCAISELVERSEPRPRGWWHVGRARTLALLADLVIVVEAQERPWELACARVAPEHGTMVAAIPGRVSSPASEGSNALLVEGARLVRGPQDALDVLYGVGTRTLPKRAWDACGGSTALEPHLARVLEMVGNGHNTPAKLASRGGHAGDMAVALIELELAGLLVRGDGGRYVPAHYLARAIGCEREPLDERERENGDTRHNAHYDLTPQRRLV
ncbi:MAG: DNA-processing protein DprA [Solirubrobacteraceae bacterium]